MTTLGDGRHPAEICRERGWTAGTILIGDEGFGPTIIRITALGETVMLAMLVSQSGVPARWNDERSWKLFCRDWQAVSPA